MPKLTLSFACGDYEIMRPLVDGRVQPDGIELICITTESRERHARMAREFQFDVCEYNVGSYFMARERGLKLTAIPVYGHRRFRHGFAFVNTNAGIKAPKDLIGKRVGGPSFAPAGSIWLRGILEEHYGVPHRDMTWVVERGEDVDFTPPPGLRIERITSGKPVDQMLADGEIDAMITPDIPPVFLKGDPRVVRLFPDYQAEERSYFQKTGIFPIMHVTAIKQEVVDKHPWVPMNLMKAFEQAKAMGYKRTANPRTLPLAWGRDLWESERALLGPDPWAYGLGEKNRNNLETLARYLHQQGLVKTLPKLDDVFENAELKDMGSEGGL